MAQKSSRDQRIRIDHRTSFRDESTSQFATNFELQHDEYQREYDAHEDQSDQRIGLMTRVKTCHYDWSYLWTYLDPR